MSRYFLSANNIVPASVFVQSADPVDLARRANLALADLITKQNAFLILCNLAGAGDGHSFTVELMGAQLTADDITYPAGDTPPTEQMISLTNLRVACYMAADFDQLALQRERVILTTPVVFPFYDEMIAGASKGLRVMGLMLYGMVP